MRLITKNLPGNVHESAGYINRLELARFVMSIHFTSGNYSTGLFRVENYSDYLFFCEKFGDEPKTVAEYYD